MQRDIVLNLFGAVAGTFLGYAAALFRADATNHWVVAVALLVSSFAVLAIAGPLRWILTPAGEDRIEGIWETKWGYTITKGVTEEHVSVKDLLTIRQLGRYFTGRGERITPEGRDHIDEYTIEGRISPGGYVEGTWRTRIDRRPYRGAFYGKLMDGKPLVRAEWIGYTESNWNKQRDIWEWTSPK